MKLIRYIGSTAFAVGPFVMVFIGVPWHLSQEEPPAPWWVAAAVICVLGGILVVLLTVALEMALGGRGERPSAPGEPLSAPDLVLTSATEVPGRGIREVPGIAQGHTVYAIWIGKDLASILRLILGGELKEYTEMMGRAREMAARRMLDRAREMKADAVINVRYMTTSVIGTAAELLVYGTAVRLD